MRFEKSFEGETTFAAAVEIDRPDAARGAAAPAVVLAHGLAPEVLAYSWGRILDATTVRLGVNNVLNEDPPLADEPFGYYATLHDNRGRYWYLQFTKSFD